MYNGYQNGNYNYERGAVKSLVQKALLTAQTSVGEGLIPQHLEKLITNTIVRLAPEIALITPAFDSQKYHEFNRLTSLPTPGGMMGESAVTPTLRSTYARTGRILKVIRRKGSVTNFLQDASKNYIDAAAIEMENHVQAHVYDLVTLLQYGNDVADPQQFPGLDTLIATNRVNQSVGGVVPGDLSFLDDMIDQSLIRQGASHRRAFLMSPQMLSKVSRLLTNVRVNQGLTGGGLSEIEIPGGWRLAAYRDIPIISSTQMRPSYTGSAVTFATSGTSSGLGGSTTLYFRISFVDWYGESLAGAENTQAITTADTITVTITTPATTAFLYKVYIGNTASGGANSEKLKLVLPAQLYDANLTPADRVTSFQLSTNPVTANPTVAQINGTAAGGTATGGGIVPTGLTGTVPTAMQNDLPLVATGGVPPERVAFWDLDEIQGLGKFAYTNAAGSRFNGLVSMEPLAKTDDNLPFLIKTYGTLVDSWEATSYLNIGLRVA